MNAAMTKSVDYYFVCACVCACVTMHNVLPMTCERAAVAEAFAAVMELTRVWAFTRMGT